MLVQIVFNQCVERAFVPKGKRSFRYQYSDRQPKDYSKYWVLVGLSSSHFICCQTKRAVLDLIKPYNISIPLQVTEF